MTRSGGRVWLAKSMMVIGYMVVDGDSEKNITNLALGVGRGGQTG